MQPCWILRGETKERIDVVAGLACFWRFFEAAITEAKLRIDSIWFFSMLVEAFTDWPAACFPRPLAWLWRIWAWYFDKFVFRNFGIPRFRLRRQTGQIESSEKWLVSPGNRDFSSSDESIKARLYFGTSCLDPATWTPSNLYPSLLTLGLQ